MQRWASAAMTIAGATLLLNSTAMAQVPAKPDVSQAPASKSAQQPAAEKADDEKLTFDGDTALWAVAINPGKAEAFEQVMMRLRQALENSSDPQRKQQAAGWKVVRLKTLIPDGTIGYVHVINPVVPGADYTVMRILYDAFPEERQALYELYRGAFAKNLSLAVGNVTVDLARAAAPKPAASDSSVPGAPASPAPGSPGSPAPGAPAPPAPGSPASPAPGSPPQGK
jgi:hypothetical protein